MYSNEDGSFISKDKAKENLKNYIQTVVTHNKGKGIESYDVVNECISDSTYKLRNGEEHSFWYEIIGSEYIDLAFKWAHEADPNARLIINDYNLESEKEKRDAMYKLVKGMKEREIPVDGIGIQMHISLKNPSLQEIKETIELFSTLGKVYITEMDMSLYEWENRALSIPNEKLTSLLKEQSVHYKELFSLFKSEIDNNKLNKVILWGTDDGSSWKNDFPVIGRTDYALCFDYDLKPKLF